MQLLYSNGLDLHFTVRHLGCSESVPKSDQNTPRYHSPLKPTVQRVQHYVNMLSDVGAVHDRTCIYTVLL